MQNLYQILQNQRIHTQEEERWATIAILIDIGHILLCHVLLSQAFPRNQSMAVELLWQWHLS